MLTNPTREGAPSIGPVPIIRADPQPAQRAKKIFFLASRNFSIKPR